MEQKSIETRSVEDVKPLDDMTISGYAIKFDEKSKLLGNYYEIIDSKALNETDLSDVKCYFNHDSSAVLGRTKAKTLELIIDDKGLMFKCMLPNTTYAKDLYESIKRGDVNECSFGFLVDKKNTNAQKIVRNSDGTFTRYIYEIAELAEISIVPEPAYNDTSVEVAKRSLDEAREKYEKEKISLELELLTLR